MSCKNASWSENYSDSGQICSAVFYQKRQRVMITDRCCDTKAALTALTTQVNYVCYVILCMKYVNEAGAFKQTRKKV